MQYTGCNFEKCKGMCCYDGVYVSPQEEQKIKAFINANANYFKLPADSYFTDGSWKDVVGRKTAVKPFNWSAPDFPAHFNQTICIFADTECKCQLQVVATKLGLDPWAIKPKSCCIFPLTVRDGEIILPPTDVTADPYNYEDYPGYISCLPCSNLKPGNLPPEAVFHKEIAYINKSKSE